MSLQNIFFKILTALFFIVFIALYGGVNFYVGKRIWNGTLGHTSFANKKIYWVIYWFVVLAYIVAALLRNYSGRLLEGLELVGSLWMGMLFYLFIVFLFIDLVRFVVRFVGPEALKNIMKSSGGQITLSVFVAIFLVSFMVYGIRSASFSKVSTYNVNVQKDVKGDSLKVVMISDIHIGGIIGNKRVEKMVKEINKLKPDVVLMAGDIIDSSIEPFKKHNIKEIFKKIESTHGVFAAMGNHEGFGENVDEIVREYEAAGLRVLRDEVVLVDNSFYIGGRIDVSMARAQKITRRKVEDMLKDIDKSRPIIIMDHQPVEFDKEQEAGVDMLLSGHTHRGQLAPANLITSRIFESDYGYFKKGNLNVIVSSGYGTWGPPIRIGSQSEIVEINISTGD